MHPFSYASYIQLIQAIQTAIPLIDFASIQKTDKQFFLLRHDVEFSVEKAYEMAEIEHNTLGIQSSYFFQTRNYAYNPLAFKNMALIQRMHDMGHHIGLHVNTSGLSDLKNIRNFIKNDIDGLQNGLNLPIDRFSFHRPTHALLRLNLNIKGLINTYDPRFFHFYTQHPHQPLPVYYFSDSEHQWKYGDPRSILENPVKKIQLLIHPYSWSKQGLNNEDNFKAIIQSKQALMLQSMHDECRHFPPELIP